MRLSAPRVARVDLSAIDDAQCEALAAFLGWDGYVLSRRNSLSARDRELVILRTGYNYVSGYEFTQHTPNGFDCWLTKAEIGAASLPLRLP